MKRSCRRSLFSGILCAALLLSMGGMSLPARAETFGLDVDGDSAVTSTDARLILQYSVGKITQWP